MRKRRNLSEILILILLFMLFYAVFFEQEVTVLSTHEATISYNNETLWFEAGDSAVVKLAPGETVFKAVFERSDKTNDTTLIISWLPKKYRIIFSCKKLTTKLSGQLKDQNLKTDTLKQEEKEYLSRVKDNLETKTTKKKGESKKTVNTRKDKKNSSDSKKEDKEKSIVKPYELKKIELEAHDSVTGMVFVQGGSYEMGRDDRKNREKPAHKVKINSFYLDACEVTVKEFLDFCRETGYPKPKKPVYGWIDSLPVVNVNWYDAGAYAKHHKKRLPTEAEWEYAARGGIYYKNYRFAGGNKPGEVAWYIANTSGRPKPVGKLQPNQLGLHDLTGNVWEWCSDWYSDNYYAESPADNPQGPKGEIKGRWGRKTQLKYKIIRGGSFADNDYDIWTTDRRRRGTEFYYHQIGFRCARDKHIE